jgi:hypothetical protein
MNIYKIEQDRNDPDRMEGWRRGLTWAKRWGICFAGLYATDELASINGVHIMFFITDDTTPEQIKEAKRDAIRKRDVVGFSALVVSREFIKEVAP